MSFSEPKIVTLAVVPAKYPINKCLYAVRIEHLVGIADTLGECMYKSLNMLTIAAFMVLGFTTESHAVGISVELPGISLSAGTPVQAIVVDPAGNPIEQTVVYNPSIGGVEIDAGLIGANASIYFPTLSTGYVWYNGHWVDQEGFYWNNGVRVYVDHPHWHQYWGGYWGRYHHWDGGWHHHGDWHHDGHHPMHEEHHPMHEGHHPH